MMNIGERRALLAKAEIETELVLGMLGECETRVEEAVALLEELLANRHTTVEQATEAMAKLISAEATMREVAQFRREVIDTRGFIAATDAELEAQQD